MRLKKISRRQEKLKRNPWITKQKLLDIRKQRSMFKSLLLLGNDSEKRNFRRHSNKFSKTVTFAKEKFTSLKL